MSTLITPARQPLSTLASTTVSGLMSAADKSKLDGMAALDTSDAAKLDDTSIPFASIAALRANALVYSAGITASVRAYSLGGTVGGGIFVRVSSAASDDGGNLIVDGAGQRWARTEPLRVVRPTDYGADRSGVTLNTSAFTAMLNDVAANGGIIDLAGGSYRCGALTIPAGMTHLAIVGGGKGATINIAGDVTWLQGAGAGAQFVQLDGLFLNHSEATTAGRAVIDASLFARAEFKRLWGFNSTQNVSILIYAAGNGAFGPYYTTVENCYAGGFFGGVTLAAAGSVLTTVNNWTLRGNRWQPNSGFTGVVIGTNNQNNTIQGDVFEAPSGGTGISDDGIGTTVIAARLESMSVGIAHTANSGGWADIACYFNSCSQNRTFASGSGTRGRIVGDYDSNTGASLRDFGKSLALNVAPGSESTWSQLHSAGGILWSGAPGFPTGLVNGTGFAYTATTLGAAIGGQGSTNDLTVLNRAGSTVANVPTGTTALNLASELRVNAVKVLGTQGAAVADAAGGATVDAEARTALNALLARLRAHGLIAT